MTGFGEIDQFDLLVQHIDPESRLLRVWPLEGGVSAQVTAFEIVCPSGQTQKMIVRRHGAVDRRQNPNIAADEFKLLQILRSAGLATPIPVFLDRTGTIFSAPCLVIEYIEGEIDFGRSHLPGAIRQLAVQLVQIHTIDGFRSDLAFLPRKNRGYGDRHGTLDESLDEGHIRSVLESFQPLRAHNRPVLLHGDYWPGNVLWRDGRLVGVIDWEDASTGDPLADLANGRLEILWAFGLDAMHHFTNHYRTLTDIDVANLPYWDLCAALRPASKLGTWGLDADTERAMREKHKLFVSQSIARFEKAVGQA